MPTALPMCASREVKRESVDGVREAREVLPPEQREEERADANVTVKIRMIAAASASATSGPRAA